MSAYEEDELPQLDLRKFDFNMFKPDRVVMLVGKRGTGKSVLLRDLLSHLSCEYDGGVAMSPTPESTDMFREFMPDSCVYEDYTSEKIAEIVLKLREFNGVGIYKRVFVLLDDCMFDSKILKSIQMRDIHMNGRHLKILFLNIVQYVMDVPKAIRSQIDYVFALREPQRAYRENLYKNFFGIFPSYDEFSAAFDACTENYGCIVVDSTAKTNAVEDSVFWYRGSSSPPPFILGNRNFWKLHYMFYQKPVARLSDDDVIPGLAPLYKGTKGKDDSAKDKDRQRKSGKKRRRDALVVKKRDVDGTLIIEDAPAAGAPAAAPTAPAATAPVPSLPPTTTTTSSSSLSSSFATSLSTQHHAVAPAPNAPVIVNNYNGLMGGGAPAAPRYPMNPAHATRPSVAMAPMRPVLPSVGHRPLFEHARPAARQP
ncbi:Vv a32-like virion packaging ATPase [Pandoravirus kuranda]|uniref:Vv a32-like virion packaging ATPase n=1 Tax=Pandoravirus kuranda TaxID=3019033 RepID=A0AA95EDJ7_9VIRU|nr:Vv a32-like virion packaging ATPase [Pandoravirus kuranda]